MTAPSQHDLTSLNQHPVNLRCLEILRKDNLEVDQDDLHLRQVMLEAIRMSIHNLEDSRVASDLLEYLEASVHKQSPAHFLHKTMDLEDKVVTADVLRALEQAENVYEAGVTLIQDQLSSVVEIQ